MLNDFAKLVRNFLVVIGVEPVEKGMLPKRGDHRSLVVWNVSAQVLLVHIALHSQEGI
jgi:hypothetical protein